MFANASGKEPRDEGVRPQPGYFYVSWVTDEIVERGKPTGNRDVVDLKDWRPRRDLNPCRRRERPVSWARLDDGDLSGEPCWIRTSDPLLKRQMLYRLS